MKTPQQPDHSPKLATWWHGVVHEVRQEHVAVLVVYGLVNVVCILWAVWVSPTYTQGVVPWWMAFMYGFYILGAFSTTLMVFSLPCGVTRAWVWVFSLVLVFGTEILAAIRGVVTPFYGTLSVLMAQLPIDAMYVLRIIPRERRWTWRHAFAAAGVYGTCLDYVTDFAVGLSLIMIPSAPTWAGCLVVGISAAEVPLVLKSCAWPLDNAWYWPWARLATVWFAELPVSILTILYMQADRRLQIFSVATTFATVITGSVLAVYSLVKRHRLKQGARAVPVNTQVVVQETE